MIDSTPNSNLHTLNLHLHSSIRQLRIYSNNFYLLLAESAMNLKKLVADPENGTNERALLIF